MSTEADASARSQGIVDGLVEAHRSSLAAGRVGNLGEREIGANRPSAPRLTQALRGAVEAARPNMVTGSCAESGQTVERIGSAAAVAERCEGAECVSEALLRERVVTRPSGCLAEQLEGASVIERARLEAG